ncbi:MAG TPA: hypothetical protein PKZ76_03275 [Xanthomonadaceae bacterium]|nr:hypothetical protein [Xanthomonadaceae bacterium]
MALGALVFLGTARSEDADHQYYPFPADKDPAVLVMPADLEYVGAFRLPSLFQYSEGAMTYHPNGDPDGPSDGYPGSLIVGGEMNANAGRYGEVSIPAPSMSRILNQLPVATLLRSVTPLGANLAGSNSGIHTMAVEYLAARGDQASARLYVAHGNGYLPPADPLTTTYGMSDADFSNPQGGWFFTSDPNNRHCINDYIFSIPSAWASAHAAGRELATGRHREGDLCGRGPALFAFAPWQQGPDPLPDGSTLTGVTPLLRYQQYSGGLPSYSHGGDIYMGAAWVEADAKSAVIFFGRKGRSGGAYGDYCGVQGFHDLEGYYPYAMFMDPADIALVAQGLAAPDTPMPYVGINLNERAFRPNVDTCDRTHIKGVAYDRVRNRIFALESSTDNVVHVWQVADVGLFRDGFEGQD